MQEALSNDVLPWFSLRDNDGCLAITEVSSRFLLTAVSKVCWLTNSAVSSSLTGPVRQEERVTKEGTIVHLSMQTIEHIHAWNNPGSPETACIHIPVLSKSYHSAGGGWPQGASGSKQRRIDSPSQASSGAEPWEAYESKELPGSLFAYREGSWMTNLHVAATQRVLTPQRKT